MTTPSFEKNIDQTKQFFATNATKPREFRLDALAKLKMALQKNEKAFLDALRKDLRKPEMEAYASELGFLYEEIALTQKKLKQWMAPAFHPSPLSMWPAKSAIYKEPRGLVLIIGPWNFPLQLVIAPLISAIAAGNCAVLKPSELAPNTSALIAKMIEETFEPTYVSCVLGGVEETTALLNCSWDYIFYTGSTRVGRIIMQAAAKHLTPVTLELGGKSPCIVDESADLDVTASRLVWGKFFNAGQVCVAPDYLLVQENVVEPLLAKLKTVLKEQFGADAKQSPDYGRIVNQVHFERLLSLMDTSKIVYGGRSDAQDLYIEPTILSGISLNDKIMEDEIFGPLLPILSFKTLKEATDIIDHRPNPLALYIFSRNKTSIEQVRSGVRFGGGCVNDTIVHLGNSNLPFGGVRESGIGAYHGRFGFESFSHQKSFVEKGFFPDIPLRYRPYKKHLPWIRRVIR